MKTFLDAIYENYIIFIVVSIFLVLALIGYFVDKKTRKDSDLKPFFSMVGKNKEGKVPKKEKIKKEKKKGKREYKSVIVSGDTPIATTPGIRQAVQATAQSVPQVPNAGVNPNVAGLQPQGSAISTPVAFNQASTPISNPNQNNTPVQNSQVTLINQSITPASIPQNPAAGISNGAPAASASTISPSVVNQNNVSDDDMPMNFNMTE